MISLKNNNKFRSIKISGNRNQCLQYCLNIFYHEGDDFKKATILWSVAHWGQYPVMRTNDNVFIFNWMLGYNTTFYDDIDKKWQFDSVNDLSVTCYIKYSKNYYTYIQPLSSHQEEVFSQLEMMSLLFRGPMCILLPNFIQFSNEQKSFCH